jgi:hypothetical protein
MDNDEIHQLSQNDSGCTGFSDGVLVHLHGNFCCGVGVRDESK